MKTKTTQKTIKERFTTIAIGYCKAQFLLKFQQPLYYTANNYGWRSDVYIANGVAISMGYAPFGNIQPDYDTIRGYDIKAEKIIAEKNYNEAQTEVNALLEEFINKVMQHRKKW